MKTLALIATIVLLRGTAALADTGSFTATLVQPLSAKKDVIVSGNMFRCDGSTCTLVSSPKDPASVHTCRALQRQVGPLAAYGTAGNQFDATKLAQCNAANSY